MLSCLLTVLAACGGSSTLTAPEDPSQPSEPSVQQVAVLPSEVTLGVGDTADLRLRATDGNGEPVSLSNDQVTWTSSDSSVASVNAEGLVRAETDGTVSIDARVKKEADDRSLKGSAKVVARADSTGGSDGGGSGGGGSGGGGDSADPFRAFPRAEGWGAEALTSCDRSQMQVLTVDNLQDSGSGSLRDAISRARSDVLTVITFAVAGYIDLSSRIEIDQGASCLYIAGQTAPGDGITVRAWDGQGILFRSGPVHDVVIRYLRFRNGTKSPGTHTAAQGILVGTGTNVVLDHLSFSWANDQLISFYKYPHGWGPLEKITFQRSLLAEPLSTSPVCYSTKGDVTGEGDGVPNWYEVRRVTFHHNAAIHCSHRAPLINSRTTDVINNVVYNWNQGAMHTSRKSSVDYVSNYFKRGPMNRSLDTDFAYEFSHDFRTNTPNSDEPDGYRIIGNTNNVDGRAGPKLYLSGNVGPHNSSGGKDNWAMTSKYKNNETQPESFYSSVEYASVGKMPISVDGVRLRKTTRNPSPPIPVSTETSSRAWNALITDGNVGASRRLACDGDWVGMADAVDRRVLREARNGTGRSSVSAITSQADVGGFPSLDPGSPCADSDADGMPDKFESRYGLAPADASDAAKDPDGDGYTNLEEFLNGTVPR